MIYARFFCSDTLGALPRWRGRLLRGRTSSGVGGHLLRLRQPLRAKQAMKFDRSNGDPTGFARVRRRPHGISNRAKVCLASEAAFH
jgi:hypothetical protein